LSIIIELNPFSNNSMKNKIHPQYKQKATVTCVCGSSWQVGSTEEKMEVEVCSKCHPYYTGKQKFVDVAGRVDQFKKRLVRAGQAEKTEAKIKHVRIKRKKAEDAKKKDRDSKRIQLG